MGTKRVGWARIRSLINENANQIHRLVAGYSIVDADTTLEMTAPTIELVGAILNLGENDASDLDQASSGRANVSQRRGHVVHGGRG